MNRSQTQIDQQSQQQARMSENETAALAAEIFDHFSSATTMRQVLGLFRTMCDTIGLRPGPINDFYPKLKTKVRSWKAQALWKKFDTRAAHRVYNKGTACTGTRVLIIGAGPCGLRTAIEAQLLGAKVVVVEKRDRISRNNVLHLWPFLITDLRNLGAKKFYGKFCAGSIDHISIRQLQCILLKVALLLGVEVHEGISFIQTIEPKDGCGWRADVSPEDHAISHYEYDVLVGADGKRNTLEGFRRKEFRGKLAIAITANFINKKTWAEAKVEEISGVAFIFNQSFFKELYQTTGIDLENIVYYKDETHYFVMTAKKHSLIDKGVIIQDFADPAELLAPQNVNTERLLDYAKEAAEFSTKYQMPNLEFAVNHYGKPDVAMFDFTSMFQAEISCRVTVRKNYRLLQCLVGDSLLEPFWPTGSGCARGFLSSMDAAFAMKLWSNQRNSILAVLAQRESIYRLLAQTTPENLHRDIGAYTLDPATRYPNLNRSTVAVHQVKHMLDTDDAVLYDQTFIDSNALHTAPEPLVRRKRRTGDTVPLSTVLLRWIKAQLSSYEFAQKLTEVSECFTNGQVLCCLINRYRPDLVDLTTLQGLSTEELNERAFIIIERELGIPPVMTAKDSITLEDVDSKLWLNYLEQICEVFRGEIPHVKHPKLDMDKIREKATVAPDFSQLLKFQSRKSKSPSNELDSVPKVVEDDRPSRRIRKLEHPPFVATASTTPDIPSRRARKRRSHEKFGNVLVEERANRLQEIEANRLERHNKRRLQRAQQTQNFYKSLHMLQANNLLRESDSSTPFEDYSIFLYRQSAPQFNDRVKELEQKLLYPDRERGIPSALPRNGPDDQFNDRIKSMEQRISAKPASAAEKKPKDLLRAIGKIESNDWNIREIEKKIEQSKKTEVGKSREKVPKWSKEQFLQRQNKIVRGPEEGEENEERFREIDQTIKNLDKQLKEGRLLDRGERGKNKVASIAGNFVKKDGGNGEDKSLQKSGSKVGLVLNTPSASDGCHFCKQKVYLMEKISAEGLVIHRGCLKCHHCHTSLRPGGYAFDRDDPEGRFYCTQHFRLPAKAVRPTTRRSISQRFKAAQEADAESLAIENLEKTPGRPDTVCQMDLLDRGQTPERIEFENVDAQSDGEQSLEHVIDENEWTDRNFGTGTDDADTDFSSSDESDSDSDSDIYEEAMGSPIGAQTLQLATDWIGKQRYSSNQYSDGDEFYASSDDDEADSQTEGEEFEKAREMRMQEVKLKPLPYLPTDTETEVVSTDQNNNKNDVINKTEIKCIDNNSDKKISTDIDKLNESLYKINNYLKLSKDVDDLKKENLVKDDIKRKLNLKSQWLSSNHGSNASLNSQSGDSKKGSLGSLDHIRVDNNSNSDAADHSADRRRNKFSNAKSMSVRVPRRRCISNNASFDELNFMNNISLSDQDLVALSKESDFKDKRTRDKLSDSLRKIDKKNFTDTKKGLQKQVEASKVLKSQSQRDLSKFFPKKEEKTSPVNVNKNQKELKDIDLSKYFIPCPVQELKSIPSPCPSPSLPRKPIVITNSMKSELQSAKQPILHKTFVSNLQKAKVLEPTRRPSVPITEEILDELQAIQQEDKPPEVVLRKKNKPKLDCLNVQKQTGENRLSAELDEICLEGERSPSREYSRLFDNIRSPGENIDELFDEVAAKLVSIPSTPEPSKQIKDDEPDQPKSIPTVQLEGVKRKDAAVGKNRDDEILSKLSKNLREEIRLLEKQISLPEVEDSMKTENKGSNEKSRSSKYARAEPSETLERNVTVESPSSNKKSIISPKISPTLSKKPPIQSKISNTAQRLSSPSPKEGSPLTSPTLVRKLETSQSKRSEISSNSPIKEKTSVTDSISSRKTFSTKETSPVSSSAVPKDQVPKVPDKPTVQSPVLMKKPPLFNSTQTKKSRSPTETKRSLPKSSETSKTNVRSVDKPSEPIPETTINLRAKSPNKPISKAGEAIKIDDCKKKGAEDEVEVKVTFTLPDLKKTPPLKPIRRSKPTSTESKVDNATAVISKDKEETVVSANISISKLNSQNKTEQDGDQTIVKVTCRETAQPIKVNVVPVNEYGNRGESLSRVIIDEPDAIPAVKNINSILNDKDRRIKKKPPVPIYATVNKPEKKTNDNTQNDNKEDDRPPTKIENDERDSDENVPTSSKNSRAKEYGPFGSESTLSNSTNNNRTSSPGIYDNIPCSSGTKPKSYNDSYYTPSSDSHDDRDYDTDMNREPLRPPRYRSAYEKEIDTTERLLERSRMIHNKKKDFMDEKLLGSNPYIRRMLREESRENLSNIDNEPMEARFPTDNIEQKPDRMRRASSIDEKASTAERGRVRLKIKQTSIDIDETVTRKVSNGSKPSTPILSRNVLDFFKRSPSIDGPQSPTKDTCVIS